MHGAEVSGLIAELDALGAKWPCIHGFVGSVQTEISKDKRIKTRITIRCYECRQTMSLPPGLPQAIKEVVKAHEAKLNRLGYRIL